VLNPEENSIDFIEPSELHQKVEKFRIASQLKWIAENSPFYQNLIGKETLIAASQAASISKLPFTTKEDLLADQKNCPPFGSNVCVGLNEVSRVHKTSGTTQDPLLILLAESDIKEAINAGGRAFQAAGLKPDDIVVHCLNYCMWSGGFTDHQCLEATGAVVVPYGVGNSSELIETILSLGVTAIHCTPSYLTKLWDVVTQEFGRDPRDLPLRLGLFGAEPGLEYPGKRLRIERDWGIRAMNANYGVSEALSIIGSECEARDGFHFMGRGSLIAELHHSESDKYIPLEKGAIGELTLTNISKKAQPLIRYRTADIMEIVDTDTCLCGRRSFRFDIKGRSDDMIVVGGISVFPSAVEMIFSEFLDQLTGEYQIVLATPPPHENILVQVEYRSDLKQEKQNQLKSTLEKVCRSKLGFRPDIELLQQGRIPRGAGKTRRVIISY
jgi:phenylacetate-CoA ligase